MRSNWRRHLIVCFCLGLLAIPIYFLDQALFAPAAASNWITLDFRGLLFWSYVIWLAIYTAIGSIALLLFPGARKVGVQLGLMGLSLVLLGTGFFAYGKAMAWNARHQDRVAMERRRARLNVIELKSWGYYPNDVSPAEIRVKVTVHESGRFAGNVTGERTDATGSVRTVFESTNEPQDQRQVRTDDTFSYVFPLKILGEGRADNVSITLFLFKAASDPAAGDIAKVFSNSPHLEDDGQFFYGTLPAPLDLAK
jgi:hypothetical protein